jgi:phage-related protein
LPQAEVFFFREPNDESVPLLDWLNELPFKVQAKCTERIDRLGELGLRTSFQGIHYRMLYFFSGKAVVVVSHGLTKEREVPPKEIDAAVKRKKQVETNFKQCTFKPE